MVNNSGQLYTIEGIAAGILMLTTAYLVLSTTSVYTPAESHISDMQLQQLGSDVLETMDTPALSGFASLDSGGQSDLAQYIERNQKTEFATRFNNLVTTKGTENIKFYSTVYYRNATSGIIQPYAFNVTSDIGQIWNKTITPSNGEKFSKRAFQSAVALPDGSIVLIGGFDGTKYLSNVSRSTDYGSSWTTMTEGAGWTARAMLSSVALKDGNVVLMGGKDSGGYRNDVWRSTDNGASWTLRTSAAGWSARANQTSVVMPDGSIVLMGGQDNIGYRNDVWRSIDNGTSWTQMTGGAGWSARTSHSSVAMPDGSIVLMGGQDNTGYRNDVWRSIDNGASWTQMTGGAGWSARTSHSSVAMPDGSIVLMGGQDNTGYRNDVWRSIDNGASWTQMTGGAGWSARTSHSSVMVPIPPGNIVLIALMGGYDGSYQNDVWLSAYQPVITNRERMVTVSRLVRIVGSELDPVAPFDMNRDQTVLMEVSLWRA